MRCPRCKSEIGNQAVCPYCGSTIYIHGNVPIDTKYRAVMDKRYVDHRNGEQGHLEARLGNFETKVNLLLVLSCGNFILAALLLVILALQ